MAKVRQVKEWGKIKAQVYMERAGEEVEMEKYAWQCRRCGRIWLMKGDATGCPHNDFVFYGSRRIYCLNSGRNKNQRGVENEDGENEHTEMPA